MFIIFILILVSWMHFVVWCLVMDILFPLWDCLVYASCQLYLYSWNCCRVSLPQVTFFHLSFHPETYITKSCKQQTHFDCTLTCAFDIGHYKQSMSKYANVVFMYSVLTTNQKHLAGPESRTRPYQQCPKCHVHYANN